MVIDRSGTRASCPFSTATAEPDDDALLADAADPERWRFSCELLIHRHRALVQRICIRALDGDRAAAEEASQRTFILLNACAGQLRPPVNLRAWLSRIALNSCHRLRREEERRRRHELHSGSQVAMDRCALEHGPPQDDGRLANAIAELPAGQRVVIQLHCIDGLSQDAVADRLGISLTAVRNRLCAARSSLRDMLKRRAVAAGALALLALLPGALPAGERVPLRRIRRSMPHATAAGGSKTGLAACLIATGCLLLAVWMIWPAPSAAHDMPAPLSTERSSPRPRFLLDAAVTDRESMPGTVATTAEGDHLVVAAPLPGAWGTRHRIAFRVLRVMPGVTLFRSGTGMRSVRLPECAPCSGVIRQRDIVEGEHVLCIDMRREIHPPDGMGQLFELRITLDGAEVEHGWCEGSDPVWHGCFDGRTSRIEGCAVVGLSRGGVE